MSFLSRASRARLSVLLKKEHLELMNNRTLLLTSLLTPIGLAASAIFTLVGAVASAGAASAGQEVRVEEIAPLLGDRAELFTSAVDALAVYTGEIGLMTLLLLPTIVPSLLAAHTIVKEKQSRSLESLLSTPVKTWELVLSKLIYCVTLGVLPTYVCVAAYYGVCAATLSDLAFGMLTSGAWLVTVILLGPLVAVLAVGLAIAVSARAKDVQSAQQLAGLVSLPVIGLMVVQGAGLATLSTGGALLAAGLLALLDVGAVALSVSLFERETILTRWR